MTESRTLRHVAGVLLLASPFITIFVFAGLALGFVEAALVFGGVVLLGAVFGLGMHLLEDGES